MLLNTCNHLYTEPHFTFSIFVSMFRPRWNLWDLFFIFSLIFIAIYDTTHVNRCTCFLYILQNISYYWMITRMKKSNNFQIAKAQSQGAAQRLLDCHQSQPGCAYESVTYKKTVYYWKKKLHFQKWSPGSVLWKRCS